MQEKISLSQDFLGPKKNTPLLPVTCQKNNRLVGRQNFIYLFSYLFFIYLFIFWLEEKSQP